MSGNTAITAQTLEKTPAEVLNYSMDFKYLLAAGEALAAVTSITPVVDAKSAGGGTDADLTCGAGTISGTQVITQITGGKAGVTYRVKFLVTTTQSGVTRESHGLLLVSDS